MQNNPIYRKELITESTAILVSAALASSKMTFEGVGVDMGGNGQLAFWLVFTGSGTLKVESQTSGNGGVGAYVTQATELATGLAAGRHHIAFAMPICTDFKILLTEEGVNSVDVTELNVLSR